MNKTIVIVSLSILIIICLTAYVYLTVYRTPQTAALEKLLGKLYSGPSGEDHDGDSLARRDRILRLRQQLGASIDSLPTVRFSSTASRRRSDGGDDDDDDEEDDIVRRRRENEMRGRQRECLNVGVYLSPDDDYVDCRTYCGVTDGVDYRFYDRAALILNGRKGRAGSYCVPNDAAACNTNTSLVLYTKHGWRCMPQTRVFGGEGGNLILACNGSLLDRATGRVWRNHIDPTLSFDSIDEKLPDVDDEEDEFKGYRFVCPPGSTDEIGNALIPAPFDRLLLLKNSCASMIPNADTRIVRPNFRTGECDCADEGPGGGGLVGSTIRRLRARVYRLQDRHSGERAERSVAARRHHQSVRRAMEHAVRPEYFAGDAVLARARLAPVRHRGRRWWRR